MRHIIQNSSYEWGEGHKLYNKLSTEGFNKFLYWKVYGWYRNLTQQHESLHLSIVETQFWTTITYIYKHHG